MIAEKVGFKRGTQQVLVETGKRSTADFALELGHVTESVQVTAQAALLETSTASISRNVQERSSGSSSAGPQSADTDQPRAGNHK